MISDSNKIKLKTNKISISRKSQIFKVKQYGTITLGLKKKSQGKLEYICTKT